MTLLKKCIGNHMYCYHVTNCGKEENIIHTVHIRALNLNHRKVSTNINKYSTYIKIY